MDWSQKPLNENINTVKRKVRSFSNFRCFHYQSFIVIIRFLRNSRGHGIRANLCFSCHFLDRCVWEVIPFTTLVQWPSLWVLGSPKWAYSWSQSGTWMTVAGFSSAPLRASRTWRKPLRPRKSSQFHYLIALLFKILGVWTSLPFQV